MEPFIGQISVVSFNFAPRGWALCNGQTMPIALNQALFSILMTTYGGDGVSTFKLPDLRGRAAAGVGSQYPLGMQQGLEGVALIAGQMPVHTHAPVNGMSVAATQANPTGNMWATTTTAEGYNYGPATGLQAMAANALQNTGGGQPHDNMHPSTVLNFIIALQGIYPSRG